MPSPRPSSPSVKTLSSGPCGATLAPPPSRPTRQSAQPRASFAKKASAW
ncbi:hypothetical protein QC763_109189 [Podospora pseudopauciseta]|uniref:Uncharacterized protein n=2 Tax=Podospora TaxID=5144 RepID=A0ABR0HYW3_9PEZI|nr:hypothetical protein QC763_109189 [Podospora pseudopauciseta]KAK4681642.1 hypothetical protein QC764_109189 [Podospora pseudoanserina]